MAFLRRFLRSPKSRAAASVGLGASLVLLGSRAGAVETEVTSTSAAQAYTFGSPWGGITIKRRRFLQTLGLGVYHLEGGEPQPGAPDISVKLRLRLDADAGVLAEETAYSAVSDTFIPGFSATPLDLMYGYVEGRNLAKGWLGFRLGRQYVTDALGWWSFDGGLVRVTTPAYLEIEAYGGLEQRGGLPLSTPRFERNGVWRGDRTGFDPGVYSQFQKAAIAPAYGVVLQSTGVTWIHGRLDYRKVLNTGPSTVSLLAPDPLTGNLVTYNETRTSSERLGYAVDASAANVGGVKAGLVYDLFNNLFSQWYAQADWYAARRLTVSADYDFFRPTFDGDSIFNFFTHSPMKTLSGRVQLNPTDEFDVALSGGIRSFLTFGDPATFATQPLGQEDRSQTGQTDILGSVAGRYRREIGMIGFRGMSETGDRGRRQGGDLYGERHFLGRRWTALARVSVYDWTDNLRPDRDATSFGYVLGGAFRPSPIAEAMLEWEHDTSRLVGQRFRILALVNLLVTR